MNNSTTHRNILAYINKALKNPRGHNVKGNMNLMDRLHNHLTNFRDIKRPNQVEAQKNINELLGNFEFWLAIQLKRDFEGYLIYFKIKCAVKPFPRVGGKEIAPTIENNKTIWDFINLSIDLDVRGHNDPYDKGFMYDLTSLPFYQTITIPSSRYTVEPKDCLWSIAKSHYREFAGFWNLIYEANREKIGKNANMLTPKMELFIPSVPLIQIKAVPPTKPGESQRDKIGFIEAGDLKQKDLSPFAFSLNPTVYYKVFPLDRLGNQLEVSS